MDDLADNEEPLLTEEEAVAKETQWAWRNGVRRNEPGSGDWLEGWAIGVKVDGYRVWTPDDAADATADHIPLAERLKQYERERAIDAAPNVERLKRDAD